MRYGKKRVKNLFNWFSFTFQTQMFRLSNRHVLYFGGCAAKEASGNLQNSFYAAPLVTYRLFVI